MTKRNLNADLIRCVAVFSVISVHFLLNGGFYKQEVCGIPMLVMCMYRSFFMTCVPLFLILTGYLMGQKKLSKGYYKGLWKTIEIYLLASIACLLFKKFVQEEDITIYSGLLSILAFKGANYAWYIEMYIAPSTPIITSVSSPVRTKVNLARSFFIIALRPPQGYIPRHGRFLWRPLTL